MKKLILALLLTCFYISWVGVSAQTLSPSVYPSTGGYQAAGSATLSWTIGQPVQPTLTGGGKMLSQGFQQPEVRKWYLDADADGYYVSTTTSWTSPGAGYKTTATTLGDCNDNDATKHASFNFYADTDGDGYGAGSLVSVCAVDANTPPSGYSLNNTDCAASNAAIHPGATEICGNGIDDNCDGNIDEGCYTVSAVLGNAVCSVNNGFVNIIVNGGSAPYTYHWSNNASTQDITGLGAGTYDVTVTDNLGVTVGGSYTLLAVMPTGTPAKPLAIAGSTIICPATVYTYSIDPVQLSSSYLWVISPSANATILSGQGTTEITLQVTNSFTTGALTVYAQNCIGTSPSQKITLTKVAKPITPGTIGGTAAVCIGSTYTYSVAAVTNATSYTWAAPANTNITAGQGTNSVTVEILTGYTTGSLSVIANGCSGSSPARTLTVAKIPTPGTPNVITGAPAVCPAAYTYSIPAATNASSYVWTAPANASVTAGQGTTAAEITFTGSFTTGNISVAASNCTGTSAARTFAVTKVPKAPLAITGPISDVCGTTTGIVYSTAAIIGADSYNWVVTGGTITGGQTTTSITVDFPATFASATVKVQEVTTCAAGAFKSVTVTQKGATPGVITGTTPVCPTMSYTYSVAAVANAVTYNWTVPADWTITNGQGTNSLDVTAGALAGKVTITATNACGTGTAASKTIAIGVGCRLANPNGIADAENTEAKLIMKVYPNPANGSEVSIELEGVTVEAEIQMLDVLGQNIMPKHSIKEGVSTLDISTFAAGIYVVELRDGNVRKTERLVIE